MKSLVFAFLCLALLAPASVASPGPAGAGGSSRPLPRVAVLVGANGAAPGRKPLHFSHRDVDRMAEVLMAVGGFAPENVVVLKDPHPEELLGALQGAAGRLAGIADSLLYFFYSGHADESSLFPGGAPVALVRVRGIIDQAPVTVKIGVVDACRGGSWTRTKGLVADEPFAVKWPLSLDNEGSVLIASSSGQESAHESDDLQGSFFTYHFTGGLRGAADRNSDGMVTLSEGFEYAKEHTIRDTLRHTRETQRPSYAVNLRGRRDLVLAQVTASPSTLAMAQKVGPLELVHAESGLQLLELPPGPRKVKLAVPPGVYLVRRRTEQGNLIREVVVAAGVHSTIAEEQLTLVGHQGLAVKAASDPPPYPRMEVSPPLELRATTPGPRPRGSLWLSGGAFATGLVAVLGGAFSVKLALDIRHYDKQLDEYRRFPCRNQSTNISCSSDGLTMLFPLEERHREYVNDLKDQQARFERMQFWSLATTAVAAVASASLSYFWWRGPRPRASAGAVASLQLLPLAGPGHQGMSAFVRF